MSQVIDILRTNDDGSPSVNPITLDEWRALIEADASLAEFSVSKTPGTIGAQWTGHPKRKLVQFVWENGLVHTTYVDDAMLAKTQEIARALKARVRHEEGDFFEDVDLNKRGGCGAAVFVVFLASFILWIVMSQ